MLIFICSAALPAVSKMAVIAREAYAATPLAIVLRAVREARA